MPGAQPRQSPPQRLRSSVKRGTAVGGPGTYPVRRGTEPSIAPPAVDAAGWIFSNGANAYGTLTLTTVLAGADGVTVPFGSSSLFGSPTGVSVGTAGSSHFVSFDSAGLFMVYVSVTASASGSGFVNLTMAEVSLFADAYSGAVQFGLWVPLPRDGSASTLDHILISNLTTADVDVTGDITVYPALLA